MKLLKISALALLTCLGSTSAMHVPAIRAIRFPKNTPIMHPAAHVVGASLNVLFRAETYIKELITLNNDPYGTANCIMQYLKFIPKLVPYDLFELKRMAFMELKNKYYGFDQELIDIKLNIFKFKA